MARNPITLHVPTPDEAPIQAELNAALVRELLFRTKGASVALLAAELLVWLFVGSEASSLVITLFVALGSVTVLRLVGALWLARQPRARFHHMRVFHWFAAMSMLIGIGLGAIILVTYPQMAPLAVAMCSVAVTGINAGALISLASSPLIYFLYVGSINAAVTVIAFTHPLQGLEHTFQVMQLVYRVAMIAMMRSVHGSLRATIVLRLRLAGSLYELRDTQARLVEASRQAGRADVATELIHSIGNVLNSVNISATQASDIVARSKINSLSKVVAMIVEHRDDFARFFRDDPRGQKLPDYFTQLVDVVEHDNTAVTAELQSLTQHIDQIKLIVASRQDLARPSEVVDIVDVQGLVGDALALNAAPCRTQEIEVVRHVEELPPVSLDRHKALQILAILLANARDAVQANKPGERRIVVHARRSGAQMLEIAIEDNGCGIPAQDLDRIFGLGFTTKPGGDGVGLHYGACAAHQLNGKLTAHSAGAGCGASFLLSLPLDVLLPA
jgi:signal transduction histidine kinase